ncbi:MAG: transporter [Candidatus Auribacter fodinae]|jgi:hypothetical protein|uniref:Transporter n=1 Tax=Candidatus Auribacter fodinae TaxID=2093366 RepID=A0A3A4R247_9BACT|nr:MAG: transporter [Candidatus Auribacter fodinae]
MVRKFANFITNILILIFCLCTAVSAGEQGHYSPMPMGLRDCVMPPKGLYLLAFDMYYSSDTFKDSSGKTVDSLSVSNSTTRHISLPGRSLPVTITGNLTVDIDTDLDLFTQLVALTWVPDIKILGADYAFLILPSWGYMRVDLEATANAEATISVGRISRTVSPNRSVKVEDHITGFGDLYVQPIWLDWRGKYSDLGISYGVYCPTGSYDKDNIANIGYGFLTQQVQMSGYYYPFENKATAFMIRPTYEWHSKKIDKNVQPGQNITLEYGVSQYIHPRIEIAANGYHQWQVSDDHGSEAVNTDVSDRVNGFGTQITCWLIEHKCAITGKFNKEYSAKDRFEGIAWLLNVTWIF